MHDVLVIGRNAFDVDKLVNDLKQRELKAIGFTVRQIKNGKDGLRFKKLIVTGDIEVDNDFLDVLMILKIIQSKFK